RDGEDCEAGHEDPPPADQVAEPAGQQEQAAEGDQVGVHHPGELRLGEAEVALDRRQRDVHDRRVEHDHEHPYAEDHESQPARAVASGGHPSSFSSTSSDSFSAARRTAGAPLELRSESSWMYWASRPRAARWARCRPAESVSCGDRAGFIRAPRWKDLVRWLSYRSKCTMIVVQRMRRLMPTQVAE